MRPPTLTFRAEKQKQATTNSKDGGKRNLCSVCKSGRLSKYQTGKSSVTLDNHHHGGSFTCLALWITWFSDTPEPASYFLIEFLIVYAILICNRVTILWQWVSFLLNRTDAPNLIGSRSYTSSLLIKLALLSGVESLVPKWIKLN